jgi:hypothetical protein
LERFAFGLGWVRPGSTNLTILALFKGSGTFFGDQIMTRWLNHLPEPDPISFHVGSGDFCQKAAQTRPTIRWVLGQLWVGPPDYHPNLHVPPLKDLYGTTHCGRHFGYGRWSMSLGSNSQAITVERT